MNALLPAAARPEDPRPEIDWNGVRSRVRERLAAGKYSLTAACKEAGVDQGTMSKFLAEGSTKEIGAGYLQRLAALFGRSLDWLLTGEEGANAVRTPSDAADAALPADPVAAAVALQMDEWLPGRPGIPVHLIDASPLNYRKRFDEAAVLELADSLAAEAVAGAEDGSESGVLQNLILRVHPTKPGRFEIAAGERRWRAARLNIERGVYGEGGDAVRVPARVGKFDDVKLLELALAENAKREDPSPMEEARGYAELRRLLAASGVEPTAREIATRVGLDVSDDKALEAARRHVQLRLQLVDRLTEKAQAALEAEEITLAQARALAETGDAAFIDEALEPIKNDWPAWRTADQIRNQYRNRLIPIAKAFFKTEGLEAEIVEVDGERYFANPALFDTRQRAAAEAKVKELGRKWGGGARLRDARTGGHFHEGDFDRTTDEAQGFALVVLGWDRDVAVHCELLK